MFVLKGQLQPKAYFGVEHPDVFMHTASWWKQNDWCWLAGLVWEAWHKQCSCTGCTSIYCRQKALCFLLSFCSQCYREKSGVIVSEIVICQVETRKIQFLTESRTGVSCVTLQEGGPLISLWGKKKCQQKCEAGQIL